METAIKVGVVVVLVCVAVAIVCGTGWALSAAFNAVVVDWAGVQMPRMDWWTGTLVMFLLGFINGGGNKK